MLTPEAGSQAKAETSQQQQSNGSAAPVLMLNGASSVEKESKPAADKRKEREENVEGNVGGSAEESKRLKPLREESAKQQTNDATQRQKGGLLAQPAPETESLEKILHAGCPGSDPFVLEQMDLKKCQALQSSLWELKVSFPSNYYYLLLEYFFKKKLYILKYFYFTY